MVSCASKQPYNIIHIECALGLCKNCPEFYVPNIEKDESSNAPCIHFSVYTYQGRCSKHGIISHGPPKCPLCVDDMLLRDDQSSTPSYGRKKHLTRMKTSIGEFHRKYYIPFLKKSAYHFFSLYVRQAQHKKITE